VGPLPVILAWVRFKLTLLRRALQTFPLLGHFAAIGHSRYGTRCPAYRFTTTRGRAVYLTDLLIKGPGAMRRTVRTSRPFTFRFHCTDLKIARDVCHIDASESRIPIMEYFSRYATPLLKVNGNKSLLDLDHTS
jgi:hypothetical protein